MIARRSLLAAPALLPGLAAAQSWPNGPVRLVVPFAPGGAADTLGRFSAAALGAATGGSFLVENRTGAGGNVGLEQVARSAPDGQTFAVVAAAATINQTLHRNLPFDLLRDFAPTVVIAMVPNVLSVHPSTPVRNAKEFLDWAMAKAGGISFGSAGIGTHPHLSMEVLLRRAGAQGTHVPFRGSAPAVTELIAGRIDAVLENLPPQSAFIREGRLRALGISSREPHPDFPDIPPLSRELGWPDFEPTAWQALMAPAGTQPAIVERVAAIIATALREEANAARIRSLGAIPSGMGPAEFRPFVAAEVARWAEVVRATGATAG
ncbi:Bug family tripartite tricarboxylate transporter substrate binding protein [Sabulicella glaciei]|uniref:Tripartite tricarboxylate transporter substrate-binding protein n=1 Tax=Sabulicella glaciei TaxID=2984948 RepID=A0ABT3NRW6_9PROT|nr:tripartite tricarboxylate transporter substrate-binding protein [Roseococcus sp. MDT2-1-1]MCW8084887.1 tripartite tricarboxylate transporter substrate-binding protein [Roseococcus sp. MDT2-1-1]